MTVPAHWLQPAFHPAYARLLCMMVRRQGVEPSRLLADTGLTWRQLLDAERGVNFMQVRSLLLAAMTHGGSPLLGIEFGAALPVSAHGPVGYAVMASKNVGQALDVVSRYSGLRSKAFEFRVTDDECRCRVQVHERFDLAEVRIPLLEAVAILFVQVLETLVGFRLEQVEYAMPYAPPAWHATYGKWFAGKVGFDAPCLELRFPRELLEAPCLTADPAAFAAALRDCEQGMAQQALEGDWLQQIRARLQGREGELPACEALAAELHMSSRTLMRKLKARGTSYQELIDGVRKERAQWFLTHTGYPIEAIAEKLGYLDTSNFSRTFRRWFGVSPKEFRVSARGAQPPQT